MTQPTVSQHYGLISLKHDVMIEPTNGKNWLL